jgi:hypothetical protein
LPAGATQDIKWLCDLSSTIELGIPTVMFVTKMPVWLFWAADASNPKRSK